jgi:hypothetical protein
MVQQPQCRTCGQRMRRVAEIAPVGADPGLIALMCNRCRTANSVLVYPAEEAAHGHSAVRRGISDHAQW